MRRIAVLLALLFLLGGCAPMAVSELYALPQLSAEYVSLQSLIDGEIVRGGEFAAPLRGSNRQSVQLHDFDGSGELEALAFFRTAEGPLKLCVYREDESGYVPAVSIAGEGSSVGRVEYADLDGDGFTELIVAWQLDGGITMLNVYALRDWSGAVLLTADCAGFAVSDLDEDGSADLALLRYDAAGQGHIDLYSFSGGESALSTAPLSLDFTGVTSLSPVRISPDTAALLAEGSYGAGGTITDVFTVSEGRLQNLTARNGGVSPTVRQTAVYAEDIDGDGVVEIPAARRLRPQSEGGAEYWAFDWQSVSPDGRLQTKRSTFHCYADGWYLELAPFGERELSVRRADSVAGRCIVLSAFADDEAEDILSVYTITGENRFERARSGGRLFLAESGSAVYAVQLHTAGVSAETVSGAFHLIRTAWISPGL